MVCCCMPCLHKVQRKIDPVPGSGPFTLIISEAVRWISIVVPVYLTAWQYMEMTAKSLNATFWGILTGVVLGFSVLIYLPLKYFALKYRMKHNRLKDYRWRPSIVVYIVLCALPCFVMMMVAIQDKKDREGEGCDPCTLDGDTTTVLQITVFGLTLTEWMSKIREEHLTYDLITAMALDFFFAYDCIQFIMMCTYDENIYKSNWVYVCFIFAFVAMFRYIPAQPVGVQDKGSSIGAAICILVSITTVDVPFVIIRFWTMIEFGLIVSDIIHPLKNIAMICFGCTQLYIIYNTRHDIKVKRRTQAAMESVNRRSKNPGAWDLDRGDECITIDEDGNRVNICECENDAVNPQSSRDAWPEDTELKETDKDNSNKKTHDNKNSSSVKRKSKVKKENSTGRAQDIEKDNSSYEKE